MKNTKTKKISGDNIQMKNYHKIEFDEDKEAISYLDNKLKNNVVGVIENKNNAFWTTTQTDGYGPSGLFLSDEEGAKLKELMKLIHIHMICLDRGMKIENDDSVTFGNTKGLSGLSKTGYEKMEQLFKELKLKDKFE